MGKGFMKRIALRRRSEEGHYWIKRPAEFLIDLPKHKKDIHDPILRVSSKHQSLLLKLQNELRRVPAASAPVLLHYRA
jgi:hypothetical protein